MKLDKMLVVVAALVVGGVLSTPRHKLKEEDGLQANVQTGYLVKMDEADDNDGNAADNIEGQEVGQELAVQHQQKQQEMQAVLTQKEGGDGAKSRLMTVTNLLTGSNPTNAETNTEDSNEAMGFWGAGLDVLSKVFKEGTNSGHGFQSFQLFGGLGGVFMLNALIAATAHGSGSIRTSSPDLNPSKDRSGVVPHVPLMKSYSSQQQSSSSSFKNPDASSDSSSYAGGPFSASTLLSSESTSKAFNKNNPTDPNKQDSDGGFWVGGPDAPAYLKLRTEGAKEKEKAEGKTNQ